MDVLVLGVSGMLGSMVFRLLGARPGWRVVGTARSPAIRARFAAGAEIRTDLAIDDLAGLAGLLRDVRPAIVINCIGLVKQSAASRDPLHALPVNALFPHQLARLCELGGIRLVHISTDCVFSGRVGNYRESDVADAEDLYGRSKLLGEVDAPNAITLRTSIVGPEPAGAQGFGLLEWFLRQPGPVKGYARAIFSGLTTDELTRVIADVVIPRPDLSGVYQVSAAPISKYDLLLLFAAAYGRTFAIARDEGLVIDRSLDSSRFRDATGYAPPDWPSMVEAMRKIDPREEGDADVTGFADKTILITGGTGSFGNAVIQRFLRTDIGQIRVLSRDEKKQEDMRLSIRDPRVRFYIGDVREPSSIVDAVRGSQYIFHAAALKQVPSCEFYPMEAVRTNVLGAQNVLTCAAELGVERMVVLSTDKAVYPINAMGLSKAMMEKLTIAKARHLGTSGPILCATRYGNVMGSRGSVIPLFIDQLKRGVPVTVTDPNMTRFLMSLEESVDLVLYAYSECQQGDILVQKAPASTIGDLAEALKRIFGKDIPTAIIGTRHGEKLFETLISREEMARAVDLGGFYRVPYDNRDLNYSSFFTEGEIEVSSTDDYTSHNTTRLGVGELVELLGRLDFVKQELGSSREAG